MCEYVEEVDGRIFVESYKRNKPRSLNNGQRNLKEQNILDHPGNWNLSHASGSG